MKTVWRVLEKALDIFELYIPMAAFLILFVSYIVMIIYRYVFYVSVQWMNELSIFAYSWSTILALSYCNRKGKDVCFTILYDRFTDRGKRICRLAGNGLILAAFLVLIPYAYDFVTFMRVKKSPVMKIPFCYTYAPFLVYAAFTVLHQLIKIVRDIRAMAEGGTEEEII